ncbi:hypothetical protein K504DRAFT_383619 [Pleomassaria siparia CBS 279.74]|uniref:Transcription initiation factor IIF subunit beta n=1 Tax=Pleomassaria siparia CBS 279.74 TaxID=1314801 RepID=A0A6G1K3N8_9PLEO|nr:hypothetical protein K504DRAFT_383619 [Pleomassaria siparia CBS 279.74]
MNGIKADPDIKTDPDAGTPSGGYMDDEFYEDTGEMTMPPKGEDKDIWLTRMPKWLYEKLANWDELADLAQGNDDDEIHLGDVLYIPDPATKRVSKNQEMRLFLSDSWRGKTDLPQAYKLEYMKKDANVLASTYVFSEKDLPGYKPTGWGYKQGNRGNFGGVQDPNARVQKKSKFKKAIPKQTTLIGCATREYNCNPLMTRQFVDFQKSRTRHAIQGNHTSSNIVEHSVMNDQNLGVRLNDAFKGFTKPAPKRKAPPNKAARIPKNELIDMLHQMFDDFAYWPMKAIKNKTRQPEAYLKEVLADIAQLVKSGPFASCYKRQAMYDGRGSQAAQRKPEDDVDDSDDEEMEDVV